MNDEVSQVRDIPAEIWIKVLSGLAVVTLSLVAFIGVRVVDRLDHIGDSLAEVIGFVQIHSNEISRNKSDIRDITVKVNGNTQEIYKLKGIK